MFDYTITASKKIINDVKKISLVFTILAQIFSIAFLLYCLIAGSGIFAIKLALLILSSAYFIFFCIITILEQKRKKKNKELSSKVKFIYKWSVRTVKVVNIGIIIYLFSLTESTTLSTALLILSILSCVLDIVIGIVSIVINNWIQLFTDGVKYDIEQLEKLNPANRAVNFINKALGVEEEEKHPIHNQKLLEQLAAEYKQERAEKKAATKAEKKLARQETVKRWAEAIKRKTSKK